MANKTLLNCVNDLLKRAKIIAGDAGELTSLVDSARQTDIDVAVQVINEGIDELYSTTNETYATGQGESTVTLVTDQRHYGLATDLIRLHFPLIDETNTHYIYEFDGGYNELLVLDPQIGHTGLPIWAVVRPTDGQLYLYPTPTSEEAGRVFTYQYLRDMALVNSDDTVPFSNFIYRAMMPAWFQLWQRERRDAFDIALFKAHLGRASRMLSQVESSDDYCPR